MLGTEGNQRNLFFRWYIQQIFVEHVLFVRHLFNGTYLFNEGFTGGSDGKESACNVVDVGLIPGLGRSPGEGNGNPLQYSA